jgi:hypothetical protein
MGTPALVDVLGVKRPAKCQGLPGRVQIHGIEKRIAGAILVRA